MQVCPSDPRQSAICLVGSDVNVDATPFPVKADRPVDQREQRVIVAHTDVATGVKFGTYLANQDAAGSYSLSTKSLYTTALGVTVATVAATALTLLMCHLSSMY